MAAPWLKVFISYSEKDEFIARAIATKLGSMDVATYLSAKDTTSGEFIFESVQKNLLDSDHFLILCTPDSMKSDWCKIELGGAMFRPNMRVVPFFVYIDREQLPGPVKRLQVVARNLNNIDQYYEELEDARRREKPAATTLAEQDKLFAKPLSPDAGSDKLGDSYVEKQFREKSVYATAPALENVMVGTGAFARAAPPLRRPRKPPKHRKQRKRANAKRRKR